MKEKDKNQIWQTPKYLPYVQPELTTEIISEAEKKIGHKLPIEYLELLKIQNGGYIRYTLSEIGNEQIYGIGPYFPSILDTDWDEYFEDLSFELDGLIPFDGDGHWFICFDYRNGKIIPEITHIDIELDAEEKIADNFNKYLELLEINYEDQFVIETNFSLEESVNEIEKALKIKFEEPDSDSHGYPQYRSKYKDNWIWVNANKVPNGFIRNEDERYEELKLQMESTTLYFQELPENSVMLKIYGNEAQKIMVDELNQKSIKVKPLKEYFR
jgi:hypothetical protein